MKRCETMSKEEIINALTDWYDYECEGCILGMRRENCRGICLENIRKYLNEELPVKKVARVSMLKTADDLTNERRKFERICKKIKDCNACPYDDRNRLPKGCDFATCWDVYLGEEIEVAE